MAGTVRDAGRQAARVGLLALASACASMQDPPGGPPDFVAPTLLRTVPDSGAILPGFHDRAVFEFDEVITEGTGDALGQLFLLSPRPEELEVKWKRSRVEVRPSGGWRPDVVYHLSLLPGTTDLSNNRLTEGRNVIFTTGGPIPSTSVTGTVLDWAAGRAGARAYVEAVLMPDSLVYVAQADSSGNFTMSALPRGAYQFFATIDGNTNRRRDRREPYDSMATSLDSTFQGVFWAYAHDTAGPQLREVTRVDSVTLRVQFNQSLRVGPPDRGALTVRLLPDSVPIALLEAWTPTVYDSVRAVEAAARAAREAAAADSAAAAAAAAGDTAGAPDRAIADTAGADTVPAVPAIARAPADTAAVDTAAVDRAAVRIDSLLALRPALIDKWVVRLALPLTPGARYVIDAVVVNQNGATAESRALLVVPDTTTTERQ